jgi:hypothetical protein
MFERIGPMEIPPLTGVLGGPIDPDFSLEPEFDGVRGVRVPSNRSLFTVTGDAAEGALEVVPGKTRAGESPEELEAWLERLGPVGVAPDFLGDVGGRLFASLSVVVSLRSALPSFST